MIKKSDKLKNSFEKDKSSKNKKKSSAIIYAKLAKENAKVLQKDILVEQEKIFNNL